MIEIWANRLVAGTKAWSQVPVSRRSGVRAELQARLENNEITQEDWDRIFGED